MFEDSNIVVVVVSELLVLEAAVVAAIGPHLGPVTAMVRVGIVPELMVFAVFVSARPVSHSDRLSDDDVDGAADVGADGVAAVDVGYDETPLGVVEEED